MFRKFFNRNLSKFQIVSDLHLESNKLRVVDVIKPVADNLIVAGDVGDPADPNYDKFFNYASQNWKNVIYVPGNHEYYDHSGVLDIYRRNLMIGGIMGKYPNLHYLNNQKVVIDDVNIIGSILWSSPNSSETINDFHYIYCSNGEKMSLDGFRQMNKECIKFLDKEITESDDKTIVVTHFMPLLPTDLSNGKYVGEKYEKNYKYFGNELYDLMKKVDVWVSGHTHEIFEEEYEGTKWLCNPYGHLHEKLEYSPMVFEM
jgi:predicted phosphodiesterase